MGVLASELGYTSATTGRGDHEVHKGHMVALAKKILPSCEQSICQELISMRNIEKPQSKNNFT
jgi:hypothetical protein